MDALSVHTVASCLQKEGLSAIFKAAATAAPCSSAQPLLKLCAQGEGRVSQLGREACLMHVEGVHYGLGL